MADDLTRQSDRLLEESRAVLRDNQAGGRHRRAVSIGKGSAELKRDNLKTRIKLIGISLLGIVFIAMGVGLVIDGIGFTGIMIAFLAVVIALGQTLDRAFGPGRLSEFLRESLLIGGWVVMWKPLEIFLYDWWPIRAEARLLERLARMPVHLALHDPHTA